MVNASTSSTGGSASPTSWLGRRRGRASSTTSSYAPAGDDSKCSSPNLHPRVVAVAGITAYRQAFSRPAAALGRQPESLSGAELWAVPNPSGLNAHATTATLATAYRAVGEAAGLELLR